LFEKYDKDKDGRLSLEEFIKTILPPDYKIDDKDDG
jgi:Ca2+-binding EF-hand superfamily protein